MVKPVFEAGVALQITDQQVRGEGEGDGEEEGEGNTHTRTSMRTHSPTVQFAEEDHTDITQHFVLQDRTLLHATTCLALVLSNVSTLRHLGFVKLENVTFSQ